MRELPGVEKLAYLLSKARSASEVDQIWMSTGLKELSPLLLPWKIISGRIFQAP